LEFFIAFLLLDAIFSTGSLAAVGGAAIVAVDGPSVAAGASAKAVMPSGGRVVELALASFVAASADRLFTVSDRFSVKDGAFPCVASADVLARADAASRGRTKVRAPTEGSGA
jgi:hypothetical protein